MSSNINPNNIDGYFPIAGQDNDSQGFRDNFTNIKNNLNFAKNEISDLQNKAILKSPLSGTGTVNNSMAGTTLSNVSLNSDSHIFLDHGTIGDPAVTIDYDLDYWLATVHAVTTAGSLNFSLRNFPLGKFASIRLLVNVTDNEHTIHFDGISGLNGVGRIEGYTPSGQLITFSSANTFPQVFMFEISSPDGGSTINVVDLFRGRSKTDGNLTVNGNLIVTNKIVGNVVIDGNLTVSGTTQSNATLTGITKFDGNIVANANTVSTSITTGALVISGNGGAGIGGNLHVGGSLTVTGEIKKIVEYNVVIADRGDNMQDVFYINDGVSNIATRSSTGLSKQLKVEPGSIYKFKQESGGVGNVRLKFSTTPDYVYPTTVNDYPTGVEISSPTPGNIGAYSQITITNTTPTLYFYGEPIAPYAGNTNKYGGADITGNNAVILNTAGATDYFISDVVNNQNLVANLAYTRWIANTNPVANVANLWVTLPNTTNEGSRLQFTSLANIANVFINQNGQPILYLSNTAFATGGINGTTVNLTYVSSNGKWMTF